MNCKYHDIELIITIKPSQGLKNLKFTLEIYVMRIIAISEEINDNNMTTQNTVEIHV